ncbi:hypothetical protein GCM10017044_14690 [Kordiimonas sediminis]|uniref:Uncharacterized protein n=1 Tax=Kordiimonas sediminis TaxID=1735581 RepID=A0A919APY5_9PROT|nr:hypothetical protein [Kordiimonas sediminis]GHF20838.1 hypothetical protein GCM10017044_14690 [Kordiimonas sediminis]
MKPIHVIFVLLVSMGAIISFVLISDPTPNAAGLDHPTIAHIDIGGDGAERLAPIGRAPYWFMVALFSMVPFLLYLGISRHRRTNLVRAALSVGGLASLYVWHNMYTSYETYLATGETTIFLGFPEPTAWFVYGLWCSLVTYTATYFLGFDTFIFPKEDEKAFTELMAEINATRKAEAEAG